MTAPIARYGSRLSDPAGHSVRDHVAALGLASHGPGVVRSELPSIYPGRIRGVLGSPELDAHIMREKAVKHPDAPPFLMDLPAC